MYFPTHFLKERESMMSNRDIHICSDYAEAVFRRAIEPMEPKNFSPNWEDQPSRYKIYRQVERISLSTEFPTNLASMADIMARISAPQLSTKVLTFEELSTTLLLAHGILNRRLDVNWNRDHRDRSRYHQANFGRGTASGGGMYPTEIYWACGQSGPLLPGLYHYDNAHHAMARLFTGDLTQRIRALVFQHPAATATDQFLLISLNFWKNSFKYSSFCYHVVTEDLGALLSSLRFMATGFGSDLQFLFWYHDEELNRLLGLETLSESVFVLLPVPTVQRVSSTHEKSYIMQSMASDNRNLPQKLNGALVAKSSFQRSKEVVTFPIIEDVHRSAFIKEEPRPDSREAFKAGCDEFPTCGERVDLLPPAIELLQSDVLEVFKKRRSSFGRFSSRTPLFLAQLSTMLYFGSVACNYMTDLKETDGTPHFTRLMVIVNNVQGVNRGAYSYDWKRHCLWAVCQEDLALFLQNHYFLQNYNLVEIGALIVIVGRPERMLEVYGNRGYRILNAEVGFVAQSLYMVSTALSFNCGAALGFDNIALNRILGLEGSDQRSMLFLLTGYGCKDNADFEAQLF